ncbi:branched-chain-amino-acid transaminase [Candidatus Acetothermia bacterium]|nr:branched-chain-amino-acid transaminase [Candidatus Acetothermia bacterium]MBI3644108.1 branched-chain-amino-acid transaminase [Candidatus Acetothermia bacterium]
MKIYLNGEFVPEEKASVSVFDHGLLYGDGIFEGIRAYNGYVFKLGQHLDRLYDSAQAIRLAMPLSKVEMEDAILETLRVNEVETSYIRPIVTRGVGDLGIDPRKCKGKPTVIVICKEWKSLYPEELYQRGLRAKVASTRARAPESLSPSIKSLNYLNNIMAKLEANAWGADEGIMLDVRGNVAEGTADNLFMIKHGVVYTPPIVCNLPGITRATIMELASEAGYEVREENFGVAQLYMADEVFLTGTAAEVIGIVEIDGRILGKGTPGLVTNDLRKRFKSVTGIPETGTAIYKGQLQKVKA